MYTLFDLLHSLHSVYMTLHVTSCSGIVCGECFFFCVWNKWPINYKNSSVLLQCRTSVYLSALNARLLTDLNLCMLIINIPVYICVHVYISCYFSPSPTLTNSISSKSSCECSGVFSGISGLLTLVSYLTTQLCWAWAFEILVSLKTVLREKRILPLMQTRISYSGSKNTDPSFSHQHVGVTCTSMKDDKRLVT